MFPPTGAANQNVSLDMSSNMMSSMAPTMNQTKRQSTQILWQQQYTKVNQEIRELEKNHISRKEQYDDVFKNKNRIKNVRTVIN